MKEMVQLKLMKQQLESLNNDNKTLTNLLRTSTNIKNQYEEVLKCFEEHEKAKRYLDRFRKKVAEKIERELTFKKAQKGK